MNTSASLNTDPADVISRAAAGDDFAFSELCRIYAPLIDSMSSKYAKMAEDKDGTRLREDFFQEASLALFRAAKNYQPNGGVSFGLYSKICIRNALVSELRRLSRKKKSDSAGKTNGRIESDENPPYTYAEDAFDIVGLSEYEKRVLGMYADGMKIRDIASAVGRDSKSVSNAVFRIKSKAKKSRGGNK